MASIIKDKLPQLKKGITAAFKNVTKSKLPPMRNDKDAKEDLSRFSSNANISCVKTAEGIWYKIFFQKLPDVMRDWGLKFEIKYMSKSATDKSNKDLQNNEKLFEMKLNVGQDNSKQYISVEKKKIVKKSDI